MRYYILLKNVINTEKYAGLKLVVWINNYQEQSNQKSNAKSKTDLSIILLLYKHNRLYYFCFTHTHNRASAQVCSKQEDGREKRENAKRRPQNW